MSFDLLLPKMAEKWREVPGGSDHHPRQFSEQLLQGSDAELSAAWSRQYEEASGLRGWYWKLYGEILRGKRVLEIGSGMGFDAVHLASQGAAMTCCDIAPANLEIVRRVARARGLAIETLHIDGIAASTNCRGLRCGMGHRLDPSHAVRGSARGKRRRPRTSQAGWAVDRAHLSARALGARVHRRSIDGVTLPTANARPGRNGTTQKS